MKNNNYASFFKTKPKKVERYIRCRKCGGNMEWSRDFPPQDAIRLVRAFAKCPDRTALTDSFIKSLKLLADTAESRMEEVE